MKQATIVFAATVFAAMINLPSAAAEPAYAVCVTCHGADGAGNAALNSPAIAGQETWYVERQLKNFKSGARGAHKDDVFGMQMKPMASMLADDATISRVAAYIAAMPPVEIANTIEGNAETGKALYMVCAACHGQDGKGLKAMNSPGLLIQQDWYTARQIRNFKTGVRGSDSSDLFGMQMRGMAMTLPSDQAINDVVAYLNSLR